MSIDLIFIDVYKKSSARISKDTNGGYGTENLFGPHIVSRLAQWLLKKTVFWPNISFVQLYSEVRRLDEKACYITGDSKTCLRRFDNEFSAEQAIVFICSSIVCFETEVELSNALRQKHPNVKIVYCGTVAKALFDKLSLESFALAGAYEFLLQHKNVINKKDLSQIFLSAKSEPKIIDVLPVDASRLSHIDWSKIPKKK